MSWADKLTLDQQVVAEMAKKDLFATVWWILTSQSYGYRNSYRKVIKRVIKEERLKEKVK